MVFGMIEAKGPSEELSLKRAELISNAWAKGAAIKGRQQQLEMQLHQQELNNTLRTAEYERKIQQMQMTAAEQLRDNNRDMDKMNWKSYVDSERLRQADLREYNDQQNALKVDRDLSGFMSKAGTLDVNSPTYRQDLYGVFAEFPAAARTAAGNQAFKQAGDKYNSNARQQQNLHNSQVDALNEDVNLHLWGYKRDDLTPLDEPNRWTDQVDPKTGKPTGKAWIREAQTDPYKAKDDPWIYYTAEKKQLKTWADQSQKLRAQQAKIPVQMDDPVHDIRAYPASTTIKNMPNKTQLAIKALQPGSGATDEEQDAARRHLNKNGIPGY